MKKKHKKLRRNEDEEVVVKKHKTKLQDVEEEEEVKPVKKKKQKKVKKEPQYRLIFIGTNQGRISCRVLKVTLQEYRELKRHQVDLQSGMAEMELMTRVFGKGRLYGRSKPVPNALLIYDPGLYVNQ